MAQKRMFSKDVIDSDRFYDLPFNSQLLYFHLGMAADVKGFVEPKKVARTVGLKIEDIKPLIHSNFVIPFESGVVVITHWNLNNQTREDREAETVFKTELAQLDCSSKVYGLLPDYSRSSPAQIRLEEIRLDQIRVEEIRVGKTLASINAEETFEDIAYKYSVPVVFVQSKYEDLVNYCESTGTKYKDYLATLRNWVKRDAEKLRKEQYHASGKPKVVHL